MTRRDALNNVLRCGALIGAAGVATGMLTGCQGGSRRSRSGSMVGRPIPDDPTLTPMPAPRTDAPGPSTGQPPVWPDQPPSGVIPRQQWARFGPNPRLADPMGSIRRITVHHDGMPPVNLRTTGDTADRLESIRRAHVGLGWADIGYHYAIDPAGRVWQCRPISLQGAHVRDWNPQNLGILVLGHFDRQRPSGEALHALDRFLAAEMRRHRVPLREVFTHQEFSATACPGSNLQRYMETTRARGGNLAMS